MSEKKLQDARAYNQTVNIYTESGSVPVVKNCIGYMFTNVGDRAASVNEMIIYPGVPGTSLGDSRTVSAHWLDVYKGNITVKILAPGGTPGVEIVQVFYLEQG